MRLLTPPTILACALIPVRPGVFIAPERMTERRRFSTAGTMEARDRPHQSQGPDSESCQRWRSRSCRITQPGDFAVARIRTALIFWPPRSALAAPKVKPETMVKLAPSV